MLDFRVLSHEDALNKFWLARLEECTSANIVRRKKLENAKRQASLISHIRTQDLGRLGRLECHLLDRPEEV